MEALHIHETCGLCSEQEFHSSLRVKKFETIAFYMYVTNSQFLMLSKFIYTQIIDYTVFVNYLMNLYNFAYNLEYLFLTISTCELHV